MNRPFINGQKKTKLVNLILNDKGEKSEDSVDAYGTTSLSILKHPFNSAAAIKNPQAIAKLINGAKSQAKQHPIFTINVDIFLKDISKSKDGLLGDLPQGDRRYFVLAHEIAVHAFPRLLAIKALMDKKALSQIDIMKLAQGIEMEHANVHMADGKMPANPVFAGFINEKAQKGRKKDKDPIYNTFYGDVSRYEHPESALILQILNQKIAALKLGQFLAAAGIVTVVGIGLIWGLVSYFM